ncbi:MAG: hypothetical protein ACXVZZ_14060 [Terriglobales bacterium]
MRKLREVEEATTLMTEAVEWSVVKWLKEKKRVRKAADQANDALDALNLETKQSWSDELKAAYQQLANAAATKAKNGENNESQAMKIAKLVKKADEAAHRARMDAEATFDEAERELSTRLAREGCRKAITSWELHEAAIRKAETALE